VRCANSHRKKTSRENGLYRLTKRSDGRLEELPKRTSDYLFGSTSFTIAIGSALSPGSSRKHRLLGTVSGAARPRRRVTGAGVVPAAGFWLVRPRRVRVPTGGQIDGPARKLGDGARKSAATLNAADLPKRTTFGKPEHGG